eukprot:TCALIF_00008-PA protein Name:"Similar to ball Nucleosomal histone kinase 1 (Drosophila melanogaster)" AED:0.06 eAED:0.06 QI:0/0.66/0.5/1/0.66/0.5/4/497/693
MPSAHRYDPDVPSTSMACGTGEATPHPVNGQSDDDLEITFKPPSHPRLCGYTLAKKDPPEKSGPVLPRKSPNGFILPDPLPQGHILVDNRKGTWKLGESIGLGGFGEIYAATRQSNGASSWPGGEPGEGQRDEFVIKVEPHSNGPLFVEIAFYLRAARTHQMLQFQKNKGWERLGLPHFVASGSLVFNGKRLRFLVLPRYGMDLQSIIDSSSGYSFSPKTACSMGLQVLDALEYIHACGYVHKDIKGSNLLLGRGRMRSKLFLVDFGLCSRYIQNGVHKPCIPDRRWAHEGTLEYTSRDCHLGCFSRRGDIEVLFYNLIEWLGGRLPWDNLGDVHPAVIQGKKIDAFKDHAQLLASCFPNREEGCLTMLRLLMKAIHDLAFQEEPDYSNLRSLLKKEMSRNSNQLDEVTLNIELKATPKILPGELIVGKENRHPVIMEAPRTRNGSVEKEGQKKRKVVSSGDDEPPPKKSRHVSESTYEELKEQAIQRQCESSLQNPTPAMLERIEIIRKRGPLSGTPRLTRQQKLQRWKSVTPSPSTPEMLAVMARRERSSRKSDLAKRTPVSRRSHSSRSSTRSTRSTSSSRSRVTNSTNGGTPKKAQVTPRRKLDFKNGGIGHRNSLAAKKKLPTRIPTRRIPRSSTMPNIHALGDDSPSSSTVKTIRNQVSQAMEAGLGNISGFFAGMSRTLFPFKKKH